DRQPKCCIIVHGRRRRQGVQGAGRRQPQATAGPTSPEGRPDVERTLRGTRDEPAGGDQALDVVGGRQPRSNGQAWAGKTALLEPRSDQQHRGTLDQQVRGATAGRALDPQTETRRKRQWLTRTAASST